MEHIYLKNKVGHVDSIEEFYMYKGTTGHNQFCNFTSDWMPPSLQKANIDHTEDTSYFKRNFTTTT